MKAFTTLILIIGALSVIFIAGALIGSVEPREITYPEADGWVTDVSGVMDDQAEEQVERMIQGIKDNNGYEIAVLLVPTLQGQSVEEYSMAIAEKWKVGTADKDDGVILLIATDDRKVRIEVGGGLEGGLNDGTSGEILDHVVLPFLKEGNYNEAVRQGVFAINETVLSN